MVASTPSATFTQRQQRAEVWRLLPAVLLAFVMVWSVVQSIATSNWADGLGLLVPVALPALLVGVLFARLSWLPNWLAHLLSAALGLVWSIQRLGPLLGDNLPTWKDQASELLIRVIIWERVLEGGGRGEDIVLFVAALAFLCWALGYATAWMLFRRHWAWLAVLVNGIAITVNYTFVLPKPNGLFFLFLGVALLLIVYQNVAQKQQTWASAQVEYPEFLPLRFISAATLFCGGVILVTSLLPGTVTNTQVTRAWQTMSSPLQAVRERWEDAFSTINAPPGTSGGGFATRGSALGGARTLSDAPVMYVTASKYDYWRAVALDRYTGRGWQNTTGEQARAATGQNTPELARTPLEPGVTLPETDIKGRTLVTQTVELMEDRSDSFIMVGGQAAQISLPTLIEHNYTTGTGRPQPNFDDTSAIFSQLPLRAGGVYSVTAMVSTADEQSLRQAGTEYPAWVRDRYLQLPDTVTERTRAMARDAVAQVKANNPYDQALAIQDMLRRFPYNQRIQAAPAGQDVVDYFLFDLKQGYCDYYASSMVVMLRSLGIPARWVQGYAGGTFDSERGAYLVRENIAHSWPEVYFPGFGWQRFEPTPASYTSLPFRPSTPTSGDIEKNSDGSEYLPPSIHDGDFPDEMDEQRRRQLEQEMAAGRAGLEARQRQEDLQNLLIAIGVLGAIAVAGVVLYIRFNRRIRALGPEAGTFARLELLGRWAGLPHHPEVTPHEYALELGRALPAHQQPVRRIVDAYVASQYHGVNVSPPPDLESNYKQLRLPLLRRMLARLGGTGSKKRR